MSRAIDQGGMIVVVTSDRSMGYGGGSHKLPCCCSVSSADVNDATELLRVDVSDKLDPCTRSAGGGGGGLRRCNNIARNGRKCMIVFTSKFNPT